MRLVEREHSKESASSCFAHLAAAAKVGMRTAFIQRTTEFGLDALTPSPQEPLILSDRVTSAAEPADRLGA